MASTSATTLLKSIFARSKCNSGGMAYSMMAIGRELRPDDLGNLAEVGQHGVGARRSVLQLLPGRVQRFLVAGEERGPMPAFLAGTRSCSMREPTCNTCAGAIPMVASCARACLNSRSEGLR